MICVSIGRGRHRHMIAEHRHLVEQGAKLVELRLDYVRTEIHLKRLVAERPSPVVVACRRECDGGKFPGTEEERLMVLRTAIAEGVEYIDLEEDTAAQIPRFGNTKRIVSHHDFRKTPDDLEEIHARLARLDADIVKVATMANHPGDNLRMFRLLQKATVPTVALCMGDIGTPSRILAGRFGAPFTYATFHHERMLSPGQLSFQQMSEIYGYDRIDGETEVYGVIADPVGHSLSPLIHNAAFQYLGLNKVYVPIRVPREDLSPFLDEATQWGIRGLSVTIPHKEAVIAKLTEVEAAAKGIGAVNTVVYEGDQRMGYNTDCRAAMSSLEDAVSGTAGQDNPLRGVSVLVLGAGGVGRAIAYGLVRRGCQLTLTDGEVERAVQLAHRLKCRWVEWSSRHTVGADILVNCTPVGMHPDVDDTPFEKHHLRPSMIVFDAVYNPENTMLIKNSRARNCKVITGVDMFVRQASMQFKLFTGQDGPEDLMREVLKRATGAAKY
jgi:3-dehydroquinate dehydratase/shikimate dehydrogenase